MLRTSILTALLLWTFFNSMGQYIDSLKSIIPQQKGEELVKVYLRIAEHYIRKQPDSALIYADLATEISEGEIEGILKADACRVGVYNFTNRLEEAIVIGQKIIKRAESEQLNELLGSFYELHASTYSLRKEMDKATHWLYKAEGIYTANGNLKGIASIKTSIADLYKTARKFSEAKQLHFEALNAQIQLGDKASATRSLFYITLLYNILEQYDSSFFYAQEMVAFGKETNSVVGQARGYQMAGNALINLKAYTKALAYLDSAYKLTINTPFEREAKRAVLDIGYTYMHQGKYNQAINLGKSLLEDKQNPDIRNTYRLMDMSYQKSGNYQDAHKFLSLQKRYTDSVNTHTMRSRFEEIQTKYETEKKEAEIVKLAKEKEISALESKQNRNYFFGAAAIGLLIFGIAVIAYQQLKQRRKADLAQQQLKNAQETMQLENQFREAELKALKSQMNPHFIFNALNSIQEYIVLNDKENAANYLGKFADLIRNYLYHSNTGKISLADELESLQLYLELEKIRFEETFIFEIKKTLQGSPENIEIPTMLIQPYVENAIKHGLLHKSGEKKLLVSFIDRDHHLDCEIVDNGVGREKSHQINEKRRKGHQSFASKANHSRLELLNHQSASKIGVEILDLRDGTEALGTKVLIRIPKN